MERRFEFARVKWTPLWLLVVFLLRINDSCAQAQMTPAGKPKLTKTLGSNIYSNIHCGLQDKDGNIWFGTSGEGVYRYDGKLFTQFTAKEGLKSNTVNCILQDRSGEIWIGTSEGLCRYKEGVITAVSIPQNYFSAIGNDNYYSSTSNSNTVWSVYQDRKGVIWVGAGAGVYCCDGKKFTRFLDNANVINKGNLRLKMIDCILEDKNGIIWLASGMPPGEEGICAFDGTNLVSFKPKKEGWFRTIIEDQDRNLLFATRIHGVLHYSVSSASPAIASFSEFPMPKDLLNNSLTTILKDRSGDIWMASDYGKDVGDTLGGAWCYRQNPGGGKKSFSKITTKEVFFMLEDREGYIWLGTRNTGLYRYDGKALTPFSE